MISEYRADSLPPKVVNEDCDLAGVSLAKTLAFQALAFTALAFRKNSRVSVKRLHFAKTLAFR